MSEPLGGTSRSCTLYWFRVNFVLLCQGSSVVEQRIENPCVGSSILPPGTILRPEGFCMARPCFAKIASRKCTKTRIKEGDTLNQALAGFLIHGVLFLLFFSYL